MAYHIDVNLFGRPLVIRIHLQVVASRDHQTAGAELLPGDVYGDDSFLSLRVFRATREERAHYELVYTLLVAG